MGVTVVARGLAQNIEAMTSTDRRGTACIESLPEGWYSVEVTATGFLSMRYHPVRLIPERSRLLLFQLDFGDAATEPFDAVDALVSGTLRSNGEPVTRARICLRRKGAPENEEQCTGMSSNGEYVLSVVPGEYQVQITTDGKAFTSSLNVASPGIYRNLLSIERSNGNSAPRQ